MTNIYIEAFTIFFKIGAFTIGGGYAMVPLIENEIVTKRGWIAKEDFIDLLAIAQSAPGPIAVNGSVITGYKLDGVEVPRFDTLSDLDRVEPVVTMLPGWNQDISGCQSWEELPKEAKAYVEFLEKELGHEIQFVSTGAEREKFVLKGEWL